VLAERQSAAIARNPHSVCKASSNNPAFRTASRSATTVEVAIAHLPTKKRIKVHILRLGLFVEKPTDGPTTPLKNSVTVYKLKSGILLFRTIFPASNTFAGVVSFSSKVG
jgi:hypothetical protein